MHAFQQQVGIIQSSEWIADKGGVVAGVEVASHAKSDIAQSASASTLNPSRLKISLDKSQPSAG